MKKVCRFLSVILLLYLNQFTINGATIKPIERKVGKLQISIDPRMEILSTIQLLSNYPQINRDAAYSQDIIKYFNRFSSQKAVILTDKLLQSEDYAFSNDAPVAFILHLSQPSELNRQIKYSDYLLERSGRENDLEQYREAIKHFAEISDFEKFWNSKIPFYNKILDLTIAEIGEKNLIKVLDDYYNETQESYNIIISPSFKGNYSAKIPANNGKNNVYACLSTTNTKDNIPYLDLNNLRYYVWHEFGHSFVNPVVEKYADKLASSNKLFEPIKNNMSKQNYIDWETCVKEHIIRAIHIRLAELNVGSQSSKALLNNDIRRSFIYIEPLIEKLKEFENQRNKNNITFSKFYPELLNVLDSLQRIEYWKQERNTKFIGPINDVFIDIINVKWRDNLTVIYPTSDSDPEALKIAQDYSKEIFNSYFKPRGGVFMADTTALKTDLSKSGIVAYGTIESNLFLKKYASTFPFRVENKTIYTNKEYNNKNIKFITSVPNPLNPQKGMVIYTALSNKYIQGINDVYYGNEDYIMFMSRETVINRGYYKKDDKWTY